MNYPATPYGVPAAPTTGMSTTKIVVIVVSVIVGIIIILGAIGIALGVGLGIGLSKKDSDSSSSSSSSSTGSTILTAPTVNCVFSSTGGCGCAATKPSFKSSRIYQGYSAVANSWPWIVALYINNNQTFCGGFLVDYQYVVTAAHCVDGITASTITVYAGIQKRSSLSSGQSRVVSAVNVNSGYSSSSSVNDIAVLTLASAFNATDTVAKCCTTSDTSLPSTGENGVVAGWGTTSSSSGLSDDLLQTVIQVKSFSTCGVSGTSDGRFCAGHEQTSPCNGDSGSPFMTSVNNLWTCTGIVSSSIKCGDATAFTRVSSFKSFIDGITSG